MAQVAQNYKNHTRFYPPFHFFVMPILLINVIVEGRHFWANPNQSTGFALLLALALAMLALTARAMALKAQDRVIRLEMYARMRALLPADLVGTPWRRETGAPRRPAFCRRPGTAGPGSRGAGRHADHAEGDQAADQGLAGRLSARLSVAGRSDRGVRSGSPFRSRKPPRRFRRLG